MSRLVIFACVLLQCVIAEAQPHRDLKGIWRTVSSDGAWEELTLRVEASSAEFARYPKASPRGFVACEIVGRYEAQLTRASDGTYSLTAGLAGRMEQCGTFRTTCIREGENELRCQWRNGWTTLIRQAQAK